MLSFLCAGYHFIHYPPAALADEAVLNVAFAFADELANQGFTAIPKTGVGTYSFIYTPRLLPSIRAP